MRATQSLPDDYQKIGTLDISQNQRVLVLLNLLGLVMMVLFGFLFIRALFWLRSSAGADLSTQVQISSISGWVILAAAVIGLTILYVVLHEAIHGLFFWLFTRARPKFAFHWSYAYAAAPDWYIPRNPFMVTTLAPLILISLGGLILLAVGPAGWLLPTWFVMTMNAAGAVGDMVVAVWLMRQPPTCLAQDRGDALTLYKSLKK